MRSTSPIPMADSFHRFLLLSLIRQYLLLSQQQDAIGNGDTIMVVSSAIATSAVKLGRREDARLRKVVAILALGSRS